MGFCAGLFEQLCRSAERRSLMDRVIPCALCFLALIFKICKCWQMPQGTVDSCFQVACVPFNGVLHLAGGVGLQLQLMEGRRVKRSRTMGRLNVAASLTEFLLKHRYLA